MTFLSNRYDKKIIEPFALSTIANSFDPIYADYQQPNSTDDFDFVSPDGKAALEVTIILPKNEEKAYEYDRAFQRKGKKASKKQHIQNVQLKEDGHLAMYSGGTMDEIKTLIDARIKRKEEIARKRIRSSTVRTVDLCLCILDGSLFDKQSFESFFDKLDQHLFERIFFITPSRFIVHKRMSGFSEYPRIIQKQNQA